MFITFVDWPGASDPYITTPSVQFNLTGVMFWLNNLYYKKY